MRRFNNKTIASQRGRLSPEVDVPAPVGGLNTRDNLGDMPIEDAIELVNWIPGNTESNSWRWWKRNENR